MHARCFHNKDLPALCEIKTCSIFSKKQEMCSSLDVMLERRKLQPSQRSEQTLSAFLELWHWLSRILFKRLRSTNLSLPFLPTTLDAYKLGINLIKQALLVTQCLWIINLSFRVRYSEERKNLLRGRVSADCQVKIQVPYFHAFERKSVRKYAERFKH